MAHNKSNRHITNNRNNSACRPGSPFLPCRYDRGTLSPLLAPVNSYGSIRRQPLPLLTGLLGSLLVPNNPRSTAQSLARAYSGGNSEAAAQAMASAAAGGDSSAQSSTMAQAITDMSANHPNVAPGELCHDCRCCCRHNLSACQ